MSTSETNETKKPSFQQAQRFLVVGALVGLLFGCGIGAGIVSYQSSRVVYKGGAYPKELSANYQEHYLAMVVDSYIVNHQADWAQERLKSFDTAAKIKSLADRSATYAASGRTVEAQMTNELALALKNKEKWNAQTIKTVVAQLTSDYQKKGATPKVEAVSAFSNLLIQEVPVAVTPVLTATKVISPATGTTTKPATSAGWSSYIYGCLIFSVIVAAIFGVLYYFSEQRRKAMAKKKEIIYEGEGTPPITQWQSSYKIERDQYNEDFEIQNAEGAFLGNIGIEKDQDSAPSPKQVTDFIMWVFDATDIKTYNRFIMTEKSYNDEDLRAELEAEPLSQVVLAQPNGNFTIETTALRVEVKIDEMEYIEGGNAYFNKFSITANIFLREGVQLKIGQMDVPDELTK